MVTRAAMAPDDGAHEMVNDWQTPIDVMLEADTAVGRRDGQSLQKSLNRSGASSVYRTVCWMFLCPR